MTTMGKFRHLSRATTADGHFVIMAIDHRTNLLEKLNQTAATPYDDAAFSAFKLDVIGALAPHSTAVLTDPAYGIAGSIVSELINGQKGLLAPVEVTDYGLHPSQRSMELIPHWSVQKIKMMGGDGVKLLLPYHPDADSVQEKYDTVQQIVADCATYDLPFFLEPIPYSLDPAQSLPNAELLRISVEMCQTFSAMGVDILKLPFPVDAKQSQDEAEWMAACEAVDAACGVPWALLSAGVNYETFARQSEIACKAGASGVIVGRAVWAEAVERHDLQERQDFLQNQARARMQELATICRDHATSWQARTAKPSVEMNWYETYQA
ncbi:MAG: tagatose 1,6-diphosphate aldolase [Anaerolineae bacterium]|nr:tagatose 1,6-diphosphate aldolase [Anaerolineae bacterium]